MVELLVWFVLVFVLFVLLLMWWVYLCKVCIIDVLVGGVFVLFGL